MTMLPTQWNEPKDAPLKEVRIFPCKYSGQRPAAGAVGTVARTAEGAMETLVEGAMEILVKGAMETLGTGIPEAVVEVVKQYLVLMPWPMLRLWLLTHLPARCWSAAHFMLKASPWMPQSAKLLTCSARSADFGR